MHAVPKLTVPKRDGACLLLATYLAASLPALAEGVTAL